MGDEQADQRDRELAGYRAGSPWPGEDGGPTRRQSPRIVGDAGRGWGLAAGGTLTATSREAPMAGMVVLRDPGEVYAMGCTLGVESTSWLERIDPESLEAVHRSPDLAAGPFWPGGVAAHANGDLYVTFGRWCHRLDPECQPVASIELPRPRPYNSLVILPDGHLVMKDFGGGVGAQALPEGEECELVVLEPEGLEIVHRHRLGEGSIARLSAHVPLQGTPEVVVVGDRRVVRLSWDGSTLTRLEPAPRYLTADGQGFGWDAVVASGAAWFLDDGEGTEGFGGCFHGKGVATAPLRLWRVDLDDGSLSSVEVCGRPGGIVANPPLVAEARGVAVAYDSGNGVLGGWGLDEHGRFAGDDPVWRHDQDQAGHQVLFADTGELVSFDFDLDRGVDVAVVRDVATGDELARVDTGSPLQHVVFPNVGWSGELYTVSFTTITRLSVA